MQSDIDTLSRTLYGESEPWDEPDAIAIAHVVMNRVALRNWPRTITGVCKQPWQFSCWNTNNPRLEHIATVTTASPWFDRCVQIARDVVDGKIPDPTTRSTHYYADYIKAPKWARGKTPVHETPWGKYNHLFFNDIDTPPPLSPAESLDQSRPLGETRTMQGAKGAAGGVSGAAVVEALQEAAKNVEPLVPYLDTLKWVFLALTLASVCWMVWARLSDRKKGLR